MHRATMNEGANKLATKGQPLSKDDKIFGTVMVLGLGLVGLVGVLHIAKKMGMVDNKSAEIDGVNFAPLPFADMAMTNAMMRPDTNVLLNQLYGGVPNPSASGLIDYITGTPTYLREAN